MSTEVISLYLTGAGVLVSGIFSALLYKATRESTGAAIASAKSAKKSADVAMESLHISAEIEDQKRQFNQALREQYVQVLREKAFDITAELGAILNQKYSTSTYFNREIIMPVPTHHIAECFSDIDRRIINDAWRSLNTYLFNYWERFTYSNTNIRKMKDQARDSDNQIDELREVIIAFSKVININ